MRLYELSLHKSKTTNIEEFEQQITQLKNSDVLKLKQLISKLYFEIPGTNIGIPASTYRHDSKKHLLTKNDWKLLIKNISNPLLFVEAKRSRAFQGVNYLYKYKIRDKYYGLGVVKTSKNWLITTFFEDKEPNIDNWLMGNGKAQPEVPTVAYVPGCSLSQGPDNIINEINKDVKPYIKNFNKVFYHGSNSKFTQFDKSKIRENKLGLCFNFTDDFNMAYQYGDNVLKAHLDLNNPLTDEILDTPFPYEGDCIFSKLIGVKCLSKEEYQQDVETYRQMFNQFKMKPQFIQTLQELGFDGIAFPEEHHFGVFEPEQIHIINNVDEQLAYHGTERTFDEFDLGKFQRGDYGYGVYLTQDKNYARDYTGVDGTLLTCEVPENEYLMDWDMSPLKDKYIKDCLIKLLDDIYEKDEDFYDVMYDTIVTDRASGGLIYNKIAEHFEYTGKQMSEYLYSFGIKGIDSFDGNCIVIFNTKDIKIVEKQTGVPLYMDKYFPRLTEQLKRFL